MECLCGITWLIGSWFFLFFTSNTPIFTTYYRLNRVLVLLNLQVLQMIIDGEVWLFKSTISSSVRSYKTNELTITGPFGFQGHFAVCYICYAFELMDFRTIGQQNRVQGKGGQHWHAYRSCLTWVKSCCKEVHKCHELEPTGKWCLTFDHSNNSMDTCPAYSFDRSAIVF